MSRRFCETKRNKIPWMEREQTQTLNFLSRFLFLPRGVRPYNFTSVCETSFQNSPQNGGRNFRLSSHCSTDFLCCIPSQDRRMDHNEDEGIGRTLLYKNLSLYISLKRVETGVSVWEREMESTEEDLRDLDTAILTLIFLTALCHTNIQGRTFFLFFDETFSTGLRQEVI